MTYNYQNQEILNDSFDGSYKLPFKDFLPIFEKNSYKYCVTEKDTILHEEISSSIESLENIVVKVTPAYLIYDIYTIINLERFSGFTVKCIEEKDDKYFYKGKRKSQVGSPREDFESLIEFLDEYNINYDENDIKYFESLSYPVYAYTGLTKNLILEYVIIEYENVFHKKNKKSLNDYTNDDDDKVFLAIHEFIRTITSLRSQSLYSISFDYSKIIDNRKLEKAKRVLSSWEGEVFIRK